MMTRTLTMILRTVVSLALLLVSVGAGAAATIPDVTILGTVAENLRAPGKLSLDSSGALYVADTRNRGILKFSAAGKFRSLIEVPGVVRGIACLADDRLLVSHDNVVTLYDSSGAALGNLGGFSFQLPNGIATDPAGNIYVVDSKANKIAVFNAAGQFMSSFGAAGVRPGHFNFPTAIAFEKVSNQVAIVDTLNNRIQFFDPAGTFKRVIGSPSFLSGPLCFTYPQGITFDYTTGVRMYVVDSFQSTVQVIDIGSTPAFLTSIGSYGIVDGQFMQPTDAVFDARNRRLLVVDNSGIITLFGIDGGVSPSDETLPLPLLNPVPALVTQALLPLHGNVEPDSTVSVVVGSAPPVTGVISGTVWDAFVNLLPGDNIITVAAAGGAGKARSVSIAVTYVVPPAADTGTSGSGSGTATGGDGTGGGTGTGNSGSGTWSYPAGVDCRHSRSGGIVCK